MGILGSFKIAENLYPGFQDSKSWLLPLSLAKFSHLLACGRLFKFDALLFLVHFQIYSVCGEATGNFSEEKR